MLPQSSNSVCGPREVRPVGVHLWRSVSKWQLTAQTTCLNRLRQPTGLRLCDVLLAGPFGVQYSPGSAMSSEVNCKFMRIALGSDHAGFDLKQKVKEYLLRAGAEVEDLGTFSPESVDYPDFAEKVGLAVRDGRADRGILVCATGVGVCISANKVPAIRAALAWEPEIARLSRLHNDANVLCLSGRHMDHALALESVRVWLETPFEGGRHQRRVDKITALEQSNLITSGTQVRYRGNG